MRGWVVCVGLCIGCGDEAADGPFAPPDYVFNTWTFPLVVPPDDDGERPLGGEIVLEEGDYDAAGETWSGKITMQREFYPPKVDRLGRPISEGGQPAREHVGAYLYEGTWTWAAKETTTRLWLELHCVDVDIDSDRNDLEGLSCAQEPDETIRCIVKDEDARLVCDLQGREEDLERE